MEAIYFFVWTAEGRKLIFRKIEIHGNVSEIKIKRIETIKKFSAVIH